MQHCAERKGRLGTLVLQPQLEGRDAHRFQRIAPRATGVSIRRGRGTGQQIQQGNTPVRLALQRDPAALHGKLLCPQLARLEIEMPVLQGG